ncbi:MAG: ArsR/SmtB family transcription factor [Acidiferrobacterales bacterium]
MDATFSALSDPTRRAILAKLSERELTVSSLAEPFNMSLTGFSKHLGVLERAGLLTREKVGRVVNCRLNAIRLREATEWLANYEHFWQTRLESLKTFLEKEHR